MTKKDIEIHKQNYLMAARELKRIEAMEAAETDFRKFIPLAWNVIQPGVSFVPGKHIDAIAEHLEAVENEEIRNLIINLPPRHAKSSLVAVMYPAWVWITKPEIQFLFASYAESLSLRDSRKCRALIRSPWYQRQWASKYAIMSDQNEKRRFDNDKMGYRLATSVGGANTGEGGDRIVYDDPNNIKEINSPLIRETANDWHDQTMSTRLNNPRKGVRICIQQRCHEQDMTGHLLEKGGWEVLVLPAEYEGPSKYVSGIGWQDWRKKPGELLWPGQFGRVELDALKATLGAIGAAGQLQQRPSPGEGAMFKREDFNYWNPATVPYLNEQEKTYKPVMVKNPGKPVTSKNPVRLPVAFEQTLHSWDMSFKGESDSDFVSGQVWGRIGANFFLIDHFYGRMDFPATIREFRKASELHPCPTKLVEDKANGPAVIATLRNEIPGIIAVEPDGNKIGRANSVAPYAEAGNIYLPNPEIYPWVDKFIEECANFPRGKRDDMVDAMSQGVRRLADSIANSGLPEFRVIPRTGEPDTACHVDSNLEIQPHWRRWVSVAPGAVGAALWIAETPSGSLRVYRELPLEGVDAHEVGRKIAEASLPDLRAYLKSIRLTNKWHIDVLLEKEAFAVVEQIGSYAEFLEQGILSYDPTDGDFEERQSIKGDLKAAKFSTQLANIEDATFDRLRDLLRFKPADYQELDFDRKTMFELAAKGGQYFAEYMAAVEGRVIGEWPKIKFSSTCQNVVAALGSVKRDEKVESPFIQALLLGMSAPPSIMNFKEPSKSPYAISHPMADRRRRFAGRR